MNSDLKSELDFKNNWAIKPITISTWNYKTCDYVMFIDENNSASAIINVKEKILKNETILNDERYFTITGCIFTNDEYAKAKYKFNELKNKYWNNGMWINPKTKQKQPVCFHSIEIRNRKNAFKLDENYNNFIIELDRTINDTNYTIVSISIDLMEYILHTSYTLDVYDIAFDFILERFIYEIKNKKGLIILESRGKKEDNQLLQHIVERMKYGFKFIGSKRLKNNIVGIYFNSKFNSLTNKPITGLELADISSYPIHKYVKYEKKDLAFLTLEKKIRNYPKYDGRGLKIYPNVLIEKVNTHSKNMCVK